ncbi:MAG TPA: nitrite/sulfite reductase, partial [Paracoccus sp.]|nr:nitrite/sulfite reductase [Paracoccus sp. (in: a-proteobacteria)]
IGLLGLEKNGEEFYQITLGGAADETASIGKIVGPGFSGAEVVDAVETIIDTYLAVRRDDEKFIDTYRRVGNEPFKEKLYATR